MDAMSARRGTRNATNLETAIAWSLDHLPFNQQPHQQDVAWGNGHDLALRRQAIAESVQQVWRRYSLWAHGADAIRPLSARPVRASRLGSTVMHLLDAMLLMQADESDAYILRSIREATAWLEEAYSPERDALVSTHLVLTDTIPALVSLFVHTRHPLYLRLATETLRRTLPAFQSASGLPFPAINLWTGEVGGEVARESIDSWHGLEEHIVHHGPSEVDLVHDALPPGMHAAPLVSLDTLGSATPWALASLLRGPSVTHFFNKALDHTRKHGASLLATHLDVETGREAPLARVSIGRGAYLYYAGMLDRLALSSGTSAEVERREFVAFMHHVRRHLLNVSVGPRNFWFVHQGRGDALLPRMDLEACFLPGVLATASSLGIDTRLHNKEVSEESPLSIPDLELARRLAWTCAAVALDSPTQLAPEAVIFHPRNQHFNRTYQVNHGAGHFDEYHVARDRTASSHSTATLQSLYRLMQVDTEDAKHEYRTWGWLLSKAALIQRHPSTGLPARISNVYDEESRWIDDASALASFVTAAKFGWLLQRDQGHDEAFVSASGYLLPRRSDKDCDASSSALPCLARRDEHLAIYSSRSLWTTSCTPRGIPLLPSSLPSWITSAVKHMTHHVHRIVSASLGLILPSRDVHDIQRAWNELSSHLYSSWSRLLHLGVHKCVTFDAHKHDTWWARAWQESGRGGSADSLPPLPPHRAHWGNDESLRGYLLAKWGNLVRVVREQLDHDMAALESRHALMTETHASSHTASLAILGHIPRSDEL